MDAWEAGLVLALAALGASATAVGAQPTAEDTVQLTPEPPAQAQAPSNVVCGTYSLYGLAPNPSTPNETEQAYVSRSTFTLGCPTLFRGPVPGPFNVTGAPSAHLAIGCDRPSPFFEGLGDVRVEILKNGREWTSNTANAGLVCQPGGVTEVDVDLEANATRYRAGDQLGVNVTVFAGAQTQGDNVHLLVDANQTPVTTVAIPGLSQALQPPDEQVPPEETNDSNATNASVDSTGTSAGTDDGNGTPGPGALLVVGLLAATARAGLQQRDP